MGDVTVNKHCGNCKYLWINDNDYTDLEGYCFNLDHRRNFSDSCTDWEPMEIDPDMQEVKE